MNYYLYGGTQARGNSTFIVESAGVRISSKTLNPDLLSISSKFDK
jgi:hypothetical protein